MRTSLPGLFALVATVAMLAGSPAQAQSALNVSRSGDGTGTVTSNPPGIACGSDCAETYADSTRVALVATPAAGSYFLGWDDDCSGTGTCVVTMNAARKVKARFKPEPFAAGISGVGDDDFVGTPIATVTGAIVFNPADLGKNGSVFVSALIPDGAIGFLEPGEKAQTTIRHILGTERTTAATASGYVLVQLSATGWQAVAGGELIPFASGVLGDQLAAVTILSGANTANLPGAQFCLGYGTSAAEMIAAARIQLVAVIPDPNAANAATGSCLPEGAVAAATAIHPQTGWWWNPAESGRGYSIEVSGNLLFLATYLYDVSGRASWHVSSGALNADGSYSGQLQQYGNGQSLTGPYTPPTARASPGTVALACSTTTTCNLTWAGGTVPIQRLLWDSASAPAGSPETGWWWNSAESGRGYFLEQQGGTLFVSGYMYDLAGDDIWYIGSGPLSGNAFASAWSQYGGGQTLTGSYRAPVLVSANIGNVRIDFAGSTAGQMTFPDGRSVQITRYRF